MTAAAGLAARDQGFADVQAADVAPHRSFADLIREAIAAQEGDWSSDDLHDWLDDHYPHRRAHDPNLLPSVIGSLRSARRLRTVGYVPTRRPEGRYRRIAIYRTT